MTASRSPAWSLDPNQRLADPAWRRRHGWPVLIAVCTLGIGTAAWFAVMSVLRTEVSERYARWAWFWGVFTLVSYSLLGPAFFVPVVDDAEALGALVVVWLLRLLSMVQAIVMNRGLLADRAVAEVQRESALLAAGLHGAGQRPFGAAPTAGPFGGTVAPSDASAGVPPQWPSAPPGHLGPPVATGGRVLDPGPLARPAVPGPVLPSWQPAPADGTGEGRRLDL